MNRDDALRATLSSLQNTDLFVVGEIAPENAHGAPLVFEDRFHCAPLVAATVGFAAGLGFPGSAGDYVRCSGLRAADQTGCCMLVAEGSRSSTASRFGLGVVTLTHMAEAANLLGQRRPVPPRFHDSTTRVRREFIDVALVVGDQLAVELAIGAAGEGSSIARRPVAGRRRIAFSIHGTVNLFLPARRWLGLVGRGIGGGGRPSL